MKLVIRTHALQRMFLRSISEEDVREALSTGETITEYPDDTPYPSRLMLGWRDGRPVHVVAADNPAEGETIIITAYEPDLGRWEPGFRRRRP